MFYLSKIEHLITMQIFLTDNCESIKGSLGGGFGYYIRKCKNGYFSQPLANGHVPAGGHWRFILAVAQVAKLKLHIKDIKIDWKELSDALYKARHFVANRSVRANGVNATKTTYNAEDVINLQKTFGL